MGTSPRQVDSLEGTLLETCLSENCCAFLFIWIVIPTILTVYIYVCSHLVVSPFNYTPDKSTALQPQEILRTSYYDPPNFISG